MSATATENIAEYLANCNGFDTVHRHWLGGKYSAGVHYVAEQAGAFWLIDAVFSHQSAKVRQACDGFQHWTLTLNKTGTGAVLTCTDGGIDGTTKKVVTQKIPFTDFPLKSIEMFLENGVLMLKQER